MSPLELMQRLAARVPRPRLHLIRYHGVLAPHAKLRARGVPQGPEVAGSASAAAAAARQAEPVRARAQRMGRAGLLRQVFDIDLFDVPYRSGPQGVADVVAGSVPLYLTTLAMLGPHIRSGKVRALAVGGAQRSPLFAHVPTFGEALGLTDDQPAAWFGFAAPRGSPDPIVRKLAQEVLACVNEAGVKAKLDGMGAEPANLPPEEFARQCREESEKWARVVARRPRR
jgi:tripartite-type tricarboxylate transporter receptor subunit TctC